MDDKLKPNEALAVNESIVSGNGLFTLVVQEDGELVLYQAWEIVLWSAGTKGLMGSKAILEEDGNFAMYDDEGKPLWSTNTHGHIQARLIVQNDGNLVLYDITGKPLWATGTKLVNDRLHSGATLSANEWLVSKDGRFALVMQSDGNLVLYQEGGMSLWSTGTEGSKGARAVMQKDGNFVLMDEEGLPVWESNTGDHPESQLFVQDDGNIVIYDGDGNAIWSTCTQPVTNKLNSNNTLNANDSLVSENGNFALVMQDNGNLVLYQQVTVWASCTDGAKNPKAMMHNDGNFIVSDETGKQLWASNTGGHPDAQLVVENDGKLVIYDNAGTALWSSGKE